MHFTENLNTLKLLDRPFSNCSRLRIVEFMFITFNFQGELPAYLQKDKFQLGLYSSFRYQTNNMLQKDLIADLRNGDEKAFTTFFSEYFYQICQFAVTYVKDDDVAKNLVQDAFVKLWENKESISEGSSIFSFLLTITKYDCLNYLKHQQVENKFRKRSEENQKRLELNYFALQQLEIDNIDYEKMMEIVEETINSLPPQCQQVFRLSRFGNHTNKEIADKLNIGVKAVEANITRALKIFRENLKDYVVCLIIFNIPLN